MAERGSSGVLMMMLDPGIATPLPAGVREKLAELELELSEGESHLTGISMRQLGLERVHCGYVHTCDGHGLVDMHAVAFHMCSASDISDLSCLGYDDDDSDRNDHSIPIKSMQDSGLIKTGV